MLIDKAKKNIELYNDEEKRLQKKYLKKLGKEILIASKCGKTSIATMSHLEETWMDNDFLNLINNHFSKEGFRVEELNRYDYHLRIFWTDKTI